MATPTSVIAQYAFANAIAQGAEGYGAKSTNLPTRSNNPGDLGNTGTAIQGYATSADGWAALDHQVSLMFTGGSGTKYNPNMTIAQVGQKYATASAIWSKNVAGTLGVSPDTTLAQLASGQVPFKVIPRVIIPGSSQGSTSTATPNIYGPDNTNPVTAVPVYGSAAFLVTQQDIEPPLVITAGLDETPWFSDPDILLDDAPTDAVPTPVTFLIYFDPNSDPLSTTTGYPIEVKLKASLSRVNRGMRHVVNTRPTRTGFGVTLWGMQPDLISGSGSTGAFDNQLGITDYLSVSQADAEVVNLITSGLTYTENPNTGAITKTITDHGSNPNQISGDSLRIAAKDAFVELLFTFKNNGIVWFRNRNYTGYVSGADNELGNDAWSPETGSSVFQNRARRNDVMTRGNVAMYFRNSVYYGYFKSLNWTEDAEKPFQWNFTFTFQVERTVTAVPIPDLST